MVSPTLQLMSQTKINRLKFVNFVVQAFLVVREEERNEAVFDC